MSARMAFALILAYGLFIFGVSLAIGTYAGNIWQAVFVAPSIGGGAALGVWLVRGKVRA
jgi:hypothetical protein